MSDAIDLHEVRRREVAAETVPDAVREAAHRGAHWGRLWLALLERVGVRWFRDDADTLHTLGTVDARSHAIWLHAGLPPADAALVAAHEVAHLACGGDEKNARVVEAAARHRQAGGELVVSRLDPAGPFAAALPDARAGDVLLELRGAVPRLDVTLWRRDGEGWRIVGDDLRLPTRSDSRVLQRRVQRVARGS